MVGDQASDVELECPECGQTETVGLTPTFYLGGSLDISVDVESCHKCGFGVDDE